MNRIITPPDKHENPLHPEHCVQERNRITPGIYVVRVESCEASELEGVRMQVIWQLEILGPVMKRGTIAIHNDLGGVEQFEELQRQLAVLGVELTTWHDLSSACRAAEGKCVYVELLPTVWPDRPRIHFQQLATTFRLSLPADHDQTRTEAKARFEQRGHPLEFHRMGDWFPDDEDGTVNESYEK